ncbi:hypothetical protein F5884DRAFT_873227 [Xylogone sp. PMI_703]|nr:hypothetical protein F5884DRAFT_873227 [Xylogone sp. PMI_703]
MALLFTSNITLNEFLVQVIRFIPKESSYDDYFLLPLVLLGSLYVFNKGCLLPKSDPYHYKWFERPQQSLNTGAVLQRRTRNGSQSSTTEGLAHHLAQDFHRQFRLNPLVADLSDYDRETIALIPEPKVSIFIMSTYGEGDPSDNVQDFVAWAKSSPDVSLRNLKFAAFGCGTSNYRFYNKVVDDIVASMKIRGATQILPLGKGNEAARTAEEDFLDWKENLFSTLVSVFNFAESEVGYEAGVQVIEMDNTESYLLHNGRPFLKTGSKMSISMTNPVITVPVSCKKEIAQYPGQSRSCVHLEVDLSAHPQVKYRTGDHIALWPVNPAKEIDDLLTVLDMRSHKDTPIRILPQYIGDEPKVPSPTTRQALFQNYLEICAAVPRETVLLLADFSPTEKAHLPLSFIIDILPAMKLRLYSISSSPVTSPRHVSLTVSVKPIRLPGNPEIIIQGLASEYLSLVQPAPEPIMHVQIRSSSFKLPISPTVPIIMVAAGTGIAPFRAFLQERAHLVSVGREVGSAMLFFGCQSQSDYLYHDELIELKSGLLKSKLEIITAFSRSGTGKRYVTDQVQSRNKDIAQLLLEDGAAFYICGAANTAKAVADVVREAVKGHTNLTDLEVEQWRLERRKAKRWFEDVWS